MGGRGLTWKELGLLHAMPLMQVLPPRAFLARIVWHGRWRSSAGRSGMPSQGRSASGSAEDPPSNPGQDSHRTPLGTSRRLEGISATRRTISEYLLLLPSATLVTHRTRPG
jgi:hypothetical protein